jgi:EmrB/QacA subfamily drug resistance transporter
MEGNTPRDSLRNGRQNTNRITGTSRWWALGAVLVTLFFASLDQTVVATAMPVVIGELKGFDIYSWVFTAYLIASAITVPIYGKLSDVYGRRPFYIFGLCVFMLGSGLSGQSRNMAELIIFRTLQGIGAGGMMSMPRATIGDIFTPRERGRWMGVISMTFGLASITGPLLGGWITDTVGWRWIFYINLPVAAAALGAAIFSLPRVRTEHRAEVDWAGTGLLVTGLLPLLLAFSLVGGTYEWHSPVIIVLLVFALTVLALFVLVERRARQPIVPPGFFKVRLFSIANGAAFLTSMAMFGTLLFLPLYVQGVLQFSAKNSGMIMTPMMLSFITGSLTAGQIMTRTGRYKLLIVLGAGFMATGLFLFTRLRTDSTWPVVLRNMLVLGFGIGCMLPVLNVAVQNVFPYRSLGVVNATQQFVRSLGGVIASPILGGIMIRTFRNRMGVALPAGLRSEISRLPAAQREALLNPQSLTNAKAQEALQGVFTALGPRGQELYHQFIGVVHDALAAGMRQLYWIGFVIGFAALAIVLFLPEYRLKREEFYHSENQPEVGPGMPSGRREGA